MSATKCEVQLLTNQLKFAAITIAAIYRERWQIELFFKALKQRGKIRSPRQRLHASAIVRHVSRKPRVSFEELTRKKLLFSPIERVKLDSRSQTAFALLRLEDV
jgi:DDE family transposase